ncbi:MAG TPA: hypothetical protein PLZ36_16540, partial [Armatimonadota bacterium]|nr:hypothetical protein [Armatimonadota bacterium]
LHAPETPEVAGVTQDIVLPPLVYQRGESITALEAITRLRTEGYLPPNYLVLDDNAGQVRIRSVEQAPLGHASTIPLAAVTLNPGLQYDRSDLGVVTRVVARGLRRQVLDATQVRDGD